jgi:hypothetical protein
METIIRMQTRKSRGKTTMKTRSRSVSKSRSRSVSKSPPKTVAASKKMPSMTTEQVNAVIDKAFYGYKDKIAAVPKSQMTAMKKSIKKLKYDPEYEDCFDGKPGKDLFEQAVLKLQCARKYGDYNVA